MSQRRVGNLSFSVFLVLVIVVPLVLASQPTKVDTALAYNGEATFRTYCSSCHGKSARGDGPLAKDLKVPPANLTELAKRNGGEFPYSMVLSTIEHGRDVRGHGTEDMPAWGGAFEMTSESEAGAKKKMNELVHYLWSLQVEQ